MRPQHTVHQRASGGDDGGGKLRRTLGLPLLLFYGIGVIVGAGIYSVLGAVAGVAGRAAWASLAAASVPAILTALCYAELCTRFPRAGGGFAYVREAVPRWPSLSFIVGILTLATAAGTAATVAAAFGGYLALFAGDWWPAWASAAGLLALCTLINIAGIRESTWATVTCTIVEVGGLVVIILVGVRSENFGAGVMDMQAGVVLAGAALAFFVFTGFEGLVNLAEEARKPKRDLPIALMVSVGVTLVLYVLTALAAVALADPKELAASDSPLATAAGAVHPRLATAMAWVALLSTANTALITLVVGSRLVYGMAEEGSLPRVLGATLSARKSPWVAALVLGGAAAALLPLGGVALLGSVSSLTTLAVFFAVCASLILIRRRESGNRRADAPGSAAFRIPGAIAGVPIIAVLALVSIVALATRFAPLVYAIGAGTLLLAAGGYAIRSRIGGSTDLKVNGAAAVPSANKEEKT